MTRGETEDTRGTSFKYKVQTTRNSIGELDAESRVYSDDMGFGVEAYSRETLKHKMGEYDGKPMPLTDSDKRDIKSGELLVQAQMAEQPKKKYTTEEIQAALDEIRRKRTEGVKPETRPTEQAAKSKETAPTEQKQFDSEWKQTIDDMGGFIRAIFSKTKARRIDSRTDLRIFDTIVSTIEHFSDRVPALRRIFEAGLKRPDHFYNIENELTGDTVHVKTLSDLDNKDNQGHFPI